MTEIEKCFFKVFGIKPKRQCYYSDTHCKNHCNKDCVNFYMEPKYPEITSDILLKLICILNDFEGISVKATTIEELKEELLKQCIEPFEYPIAFEEHYEIDKLYQQIRALFKEGAEDE